MQLQDIYIYPIKSLGGIRLDSWVLEEKGFKYDRRWMLIDERGVFLSQRKHPKMALLQVSLGKDGLKVVSKTDSENYLEIPFESKAEGRTMVQIWEDEVEAEVLESKFCTWFSDFLGFSTRLVSMPDSTERKLKPKYAINDESVSFADGMPYLLIGQSSLDDLNSRLEKQIPMDRFRPNLVFSGGSAFEEDTWDSLKIGDSIFKVTKPCARCVMTTVDQDTAKKGKEPLKTLSSYRTVDKNVLFGQNMLLIEGKKVSVGDVLIPQKK
ncbi:Flavodoxin reductases (ferredoxin-NADPH reductases) family 1 [Indibacter alkaliphilus LW1]|uniref:Flavodoxin reductases (Ferredoxin-NADPH reductases) family 1 n=1 Tax=Indibacter alkaliphilus (strain CCUG 57479 / KCTC 22604 / LW1) TaxID=1189612 RepID=S2E3N9_INDAL|nr:MOSC N-terminal beta barrel domain-containing protein [Indibacter alkaliphilus]EOZ99121.1 Flavodoxin reductases (ferredoxin-NADPH reductases) family 1 [Indibacter alkaliphilus LW1]